MQLNLYNSAGGIGDSVCALYAACGAANAGHEVIYHARHHDWFARVSHPNLTLLAHAETGINCNSDYEAHIRSGSDRKRYYCDSIARGAGIEPFAPAAPAKINREHRAATHGVRGKTNVVLLSPFSAWRAREWPSPHFARLAELLHAGGFDVVALVTAADAARAQVEFGYLGSWMSWVYGHDAAWVGDAILAARCVVGNDSGIAHYAGLLGAPTVAIHAQLAPQILWSCSEVRAVTPDTKCRFCGWQREKSYSDACDRGCSALSSISPETVLKEVLNNAK